MGDKLEVPGLALSEYPAPENERREQLPGCKVEGMLEGRRPRLVSTVVTWSKD